MIASIPQLEALRSDFLRGIDRAMSRVFRTISQFAEEEIVLPPTGPFPEQRFSTERQPFVKLWFDLIVRQIHSLCGYATAGN